MGAKPFTTQQMKQVSVMIIEDSRVVRTFLEEIIGRDPRLRVVASVGSGEEALRVINSAAPDVISLDIRLPGMNGFEVTKRIMSHRPTPIVVVSSDVENEELKISMNALRAGALAVVQKPVGFAHTDYQKLADSLCTKLVIMSQVRVIRQSAALTRSESYDVASQILPPAVPLPQSSLVMTPRILGLVASTGGPNALVRVLSDLSRAFPAPILIVQHISPGFLRGFVSWLGEVVRRPVVEAESGQLLRGGTIYVAPADRHLILGTRERLHLIESESVCLQRPSGTVLLESLARVFGPEAAGVVLTGMGEDGAAGLKAMHCAGALTIAESESTAVVYGMPAAAARMGAARELLPLHQIAPRLNKAFLCETPETSE